MIKRASDGMGLRYGTAGKKLEGSALTKFMGQLNDYLGVFDKANKHCATGSYGVASQVRADEADGLRGRRQGAPKIAKLHSELQKMAKRSEFKAVGEPRYEEEHRTWSVSFR